MKNRHIRCVIYILTLRTIYLRSLFVVTTIIIIATIIGAASTPRGYRDKIVTLLLIRRKGESPQEVACKFSSERTWVRSTCRRFVACTHLSPACIAAFRTLHPPPLSSPIPQAPSSLQIYCTFYEVEKLESLNDEGERISLVTFFPNSVSITREVSDILNENETRYKKYVKKIL